MFWLLPDTPVTAKFLSPEQRVHAVERLRSNQTVVKNRHFQWYQFREALVDPRIWLIVLFLIAVSICSSAIAAVLISLFRALLESVLLTKTLVHSYCNRGARLRRLSG